MLSHAPITSSHAQIPALLPVQHAAAPAQRAAAELQMTRSRQVVSISCLMNLCQDPVGALPALHCSPWLCLRIYLSKPCQLLGFVPNLVLRDKPLTTQESSRAHGSCQRNVSTILMELPDSIFTDRTHFQRTGPRLGTQPGCFFHYRQGREQKRTEQLRFWDAEST